VASFDEVEIRILGCLIEKQRTTPGGYPLSLNALRTACNQSTNRDPVVDYDESTLRRALASLAERRWVRSGTGHGGRAVKYRHLIGDHLTVSEGQLSLLAVLMLRGPQTPGELKQRVDRLSPFDDLASVHTALEALAAAELVQGLPRRPGQKEERYRHLLGGRDREEERSDVSVPDPAAGAEPGQPDIARLEAQLGELSRRLEELERRLGSS
jgi:uncharacterized protein